ncbi:MAG: hypothetical protein DRR19_25305 [Candidatus Parabeggiatoa sp. nov. 1]|nr:MAG: hypothetical protein DRR19_25305 [Gammaproteobacteria bacterium]
MVAPDIFEGCLKFFRFFGNEELCSEIFAANVFVCINVCDTKDSSHLFLITKAQVMPVIKGETINEKSMY